nr:MAG TPA: hypothetical protein [Bacteriophage sp.]
MSALPTSNKGKSALFIAIDFYLVTTPTHS